MISFSVNLFRFQLEKTIKKPDLSDPKKLDKPIADSKIFSKDDVEHKIISILSDGLNKNNLPAKKPDTSNTTSDTIITDKTKLTVIKSDEADIKKDSTSHSKTESDKLSEPNTKSSHKPTNRIYGISIKKLSRLSLVKNVRIDGDKKIISYSKMSVIAGYDVDKANIKSSVISDKRKIAEGSKQFQDKLLHKKKEQIEYNELRQSEIESEKKLQCDKDNELLKNQDKKAGERYSINNSDSSLEKHIKP